MADYNQRGPQERAPFSFPGMGGQPFVTWILLAANVLVWVLMEGAGGSKDPQTLLDFGAMFGPYIADGEYWRLFTAMFLHAGLLHLFFNCLGLFLFGRLVEQVYGHLPYATIYVAAGLLGSVTSYLLNSVAIGAGASGAIFGVLGALAAFFVARRKVLGEMGRQNLMGILVLAAINLVFGFVTPGVDNWAHMGGFVGGFVLGFAFAPESRPAFNLLPLTGSGAHTSPLVRRWWVLALAVAVLIAGARLGTHNVANSPLTHLHRAEGYLAQGDYNGALGEIRLAIDVDPAIGQAYYLRGRALAELGDIRQARADLSRALQLGLDTETAREAVSLLITLNLRR